jgi:hypothetical protein
MAEKPARSAGRPVSRAAAGLWASGHGVEPVIPLAQGGNLGAHSVGSGSRSGAARCD